MRTYFEDVRSGTGCGLEVGLERRTGPHHRRLRGWVRRGDFRWRVDFADARLWIPLGLRVGRACE